MKTVDYARIIFVGTTSLAVGVTTQLTVAAIMSAVPIANNVFRTIGVIGSIGAGVTACNMMIEPAEKAFDEYVDMSKEVSDILSGN